MKRAVPIPEITMKEIGYCWIKLTPLWAPTPKIPNRMRERKSASNREVRNAFSQKGKTRPRNDSVLGFMTKYKRKRPQNTRNSDSILYDIIIRPGRDYAVTVPHTCSTVTPLFTVKIGWK